MSSAPIAKKQPVQYAAHGQIRIDSYAWMRAENWQDVLSDPSKLDPEITAYLKAENAHFHAYMAPQEALRDTLFDEMKGRIKEQDDSIPTKNKTHVYWSRFEEGKQYAILMRAPADTPDKGEIVWDSNLAAAHVPYYTLSVATANPQDQLMILGEDTTGSEELVLRVLNMETGTFLDDQIEGAAPGVVWDKQGRSFFYTLLDDNHRPFEVRHHILGQDAANDTLVYREENPGFFVAPGKTESGEYILISTGDHITSEIHLIPADAPATPPVCVATRQEGHEYSLTHESDWFYILTNRNGESVDFEIAKTPVCAPHIENWQTFVSHKAGRLILSISSVDGYLMRMERENALPRLVVTDLSRNKDKLIDMTEPAYALGAGPASGDFTDQIIRYSYSSPATPSSTYDLNLVTNERVLRKVQEVPSGHEISDYIVERAMAPARDGAEVPLTLLRRKNTGPQAPAYLYGYGSYGMTMAAGFSTNILSLVDRGFVYALAHIRGGMEKGYSWYLDGKMLNKQNTFNDFEDCARYLIDQGITAKGKIAIEGGSAGGMLMGAVMNQAPDLFGAVAAHVPFVDVLNTISDASLPLTPIEWNEWGNPIEDAEAYAAMAAYCPYSNVSAQAYPPLMVTAGVSDPRVTYWEPAKWVAKLRAYRTNDESLIFKTNMEAGHGGRSGRFEHLHEKAETYAFFLNELLRR